MIKKTVGKHLSRQEKEFFRTPEEYENHILKTAEEVKNIREALLKHANFNEWLDLYETKAREELRGAGLPDVARVLVDKGDFSKWRPLPPLPDNQKDLPDWKNKNAKHGHESEMSLDDYLLHAGYDCDGPEHITSRLLVHINRFKENLAAGSAFNINLAFHTVFLIGVYTTLKRAYGKHTKGSSIGGKGIVNPWREYGKQLREQHPNMPQNQIWSKIFRTAARKKKEEERELEKYDKEPAFPITEILVFESEDFEIYADLEKKMLKAVFTDFKGLVKDTRETAFNNFRRYLKSY